MQTWQLIHFGKRKVFGQKRFPIEFGPLPTSRSSPTKFVKTLWIKDDIRTRQLPNPDLRGLPRRQRVLSGVPIPGNERASDIGHRRRMRNDPRWHFRSNQNYGFVDAEGGCQTLISTKPNPTTKPHDAADPVRRTCPRSWAGEDAMKRSFYPTKPWPPRVA